MKKHWKIILIVLLCMYSTLIFSLLSYSFTPDDSYRTYKVADNLVNGNGVRWNATDEVPTQTFTTLMWIWILALWHIISGISFINISKIIGITSSLLTIFLLGFYNYRRRGLINATFATLSFALLPVVMFHSVSGMETAYETLLLTITTILYIESTKNRSLMPWLFLFMLMAVITRYEFVLFSGVLFLSSMFNNRHDLKPVFLQATKILIIPGLLYLTWKIFYFGGILPSTFFVKTSPHIISSSGLSYLISNYQNYYLINVIVLFCLFPFFTDGNKFKYLILLLAIHLQLGFIARTLPAVGYGGRFIYPLIPSFLIIVAAVPVQIMLQRFRESELPTKIVAVLSIFLMFYGTHANSRVDSLITMRNYYAGVASWSPNIGKALKDIIPNSDSVVVCTGQAGAIPYFSGFTHLDLWGLHNTHIARNGIDADYIFSNNPDIFITFIPTGVLKGSENGSFELDYNILDNTIDYCRQNKTTRCNTTYASFVVMTDLRFRKFKYIRSMSFSKGSKEKEWVFFIKDDFPYFDKTSERIKSIDFNPAMDLVRKSMSPKIYLMALINPFSGIRGIKKDPFF